MTYKSFLLAGIVLLTPTAYAIDCSDKAYSDTISELVELTGEAHIDQTLREEYKAEKTAEAAAEKKAKAKLKELEDELAKLEELREALEEALGEFVEDAYEDDSVTDKAYEKYEKAEELVEQLKKAIEDARAISESGGSAVDALTGLSITLERLSGLLGPLINKVPTVGPFLELYGKAIGKIAEDIGFIEKKILEQRDLSKLGLSDLYGSDYQRERAEALKKEERIRALKAKYKKMLEECE